VQALRLQLQVHLLQELVVAAVVVVTTEQQGQVVQAAVVVEVLAQRVLRVLRILAVVAVVLATYFQAAIPAEAQVVRVL
jgi:hypothetical protein